MTRVNTLKDIEKIYESTTMQEGPFAEVIEENTKVKASKEPKPNKGFEEDTKNATKPSKGTGPESADGFEKAVVEAGGTGQREKENQFSAGKVAKESINTSNKEQSMGNKNKSIFDKLYEDVLGGDEDMNGFEDLGAEDELGGDDDFGEEEGGDEVTLSLPRDLAEALLDALSGQIGGDEDIEDIEDIEGDEFGDEDAPEDEMPFQEAPDVEILGHALTGDIDKGNLKGKSNKVSGSGPAHSGGGGDGDGKLKGGNPEPTDLGDKSGHLTGKNNKVGGKVKGKDQELFAG